MATKKESKKEAKKETKKRGCKWCNAPFERLVTVEKEVKVFDGRKVEKAPNGGKFMAKIVYCRDCGEMNRFYGPKLVEVKK